MAPLSFPVPEDEGERLAALRRYDVVDTQPEPEFDDIVRFAGDLFRAPIALVSFVEDRRQFLKARVALDACETSRDVSFCAHTIVSRAVLIVPDACKDERFRNNPLVTGPPFIRFYAGAPLKQVGERIAKLSPSSALVGRLGGHEFGVLLPGSGNEDTAAEIAVSLLRLFYQPFEVFGRRILVSASAGVFVASEEAGLDADKALKAALLALQIAKREGSGRVEVFRPALSARADELRLLEDELRSAYERGQFELFYQPQFRLADGRIGGAEALLRWRHPERGLLSPAAFLDVLEASPLTIPVGSWIIGEAARFASDLARRGTPIRIGVNLSAAQLADRDLVETATSALAEHRLSPELLELEITERTGLKLDEDVVGPLRLLRDLGVGIAFDDYGTGYASLSLLKRYPLTRLKIDREFVRNLETDPDDAAIIKAVLMMGQSLGLLVTAEGIETNAQADSLEPIRKEVESRESGVIPS